jgi:hypothetical protein
MSEGFLAISQLKYQLARLRVLKTWMMVEQSGLLVPVGVKTDGVFVRRLVKREVAARRKTRSIFEQKVEKAPQRAPKTSSAQTASLFDAFIEANYDEFTMPDDSTYASIGKLHVEGKTAVPYGKGWSPRLTKVEFEERRLILEPAKTVVLDIEGEELYSSANEEERLRFVIGVEQAIVEHGAIFLEGGAGYGKSTLVKELIRRELARNKPNWKYVILGPIGSLIDDVWKGFNAMTDASALGNVVNTDGEQVQHTSGLDFEGVQLLVVDEAYLCILENILKIKSCFGIIADIEFHFIANSRNKIDIHLHIKIEDAILLCTLGKCWVFNVLPITTKSHIYISLRPYGNRTTSKDAIKYPIFIHDWQLWFLLKKRQGI